MMLCGISLASASRCAHRLARRLSMMKDNLESREGFMQEKAQVEKDFNEQVAVGAMRPEDFNRKSMVDLEKVCISSHLASHPSTA